MLPRAAVPWVVTENPRDPATGRVPQRGCDTRPAPPPPVDGRGTRYVDTPLRVLGDIAGLTR